MFFAIHDCVQAQRPSSDRAALEESPSFTGRASSCYSLLYHLPALRSLLNRSGPAAIRHSIIHITPQSFQPHHLTSGTAFAIDLSCPHFHISLRDLVRFFWAMSTVMSSSGSSGVVWVSYVLGDGRNNIYNMVQGSQCGICTKALRIPTT